MLKVAIIYVPGTGGSFFRRVLSLSESTIVSNSTKQISAEEKFELFNNWDAKNWKASEQLGCPAYRDGSEDFFYFEESHLSLIDAWHPTEFLEHDQKENCWTTGAWPHLTFIDVKDSHHNFILKNQRTKTYTLDWNKEIQHMHELKQLYVDRSITIDFDDLLQKSTFESCLTRINSKFELDLRLDLAVALWDKWYDQSQQTWIR